MDFQSKSKAAFPWEQGFREGKLHNASGVRFAAFHKISHYLNSDVFMSYMDKRSYCSEHVFIWTSLLLELALFSSFFFFSLYQVRTKVSFIAVLWTSYKWQFLHINRQFNNTNDKRGIENNRLIFWQANQNLQRRFYTARLYSPVLSEAWGVRIKIKPLTR